ncbi:MAG: hypothetical protein D6693_07610 [Planctomycetota bacterium]|nr:MAG: hypothetical protein D6693_07610 [Planctomycetota bacterium]
MDKATAESLLRALHAGRDLARVARSHGLSMRELAHWASTGAGAEAISALRALARARADAARALARLARGADDTARKACVDLLRLPDAEPAADRRADEDLTADEARAWLDALETLGADAPAGPDPAANGPGASAPRANPS